MKETALSRDGSGLYFFCITPPGLAPAHGRRSVANERICRLMSTASTGNTGRTHTGTGANSAHPSSEIQTIRHDTTFTRRGSALCPPRKRRTYSPKCRFCRSFRYNRGELLAKHQAESRRKGVVGRTGRKIPATPSPMLANPAATSRERSRPRSRKGGTGRRGVAMGKERG